MHFRRLYARKGLFVCVMTISTIFFALWVLPDLTDSTAFSQKRERLAPKGQASVLPNESSLTGICDTGLPIEVESTGGTSSQGYPTLGAAFTAINTGVHTGTISVEVCGDTIETATAIINASSGSSSYSSITVRPVGQARVIEGTVVGAVIKLNGADGVMFDGRIGGVGTNRDLTIRNNSASTGTAAIWLSSLGVGLGATNNTIRNIEIAAGVTQNTSALVTFGILMNGASIAVGTNGNDNDNNSFIDNRITRVRYGIVTRGNPSGPNLNENTVILNNIIGPSIFGPDEIGKVGLLLQADNNCTVSGNLIQSVGGDLANTPGGADRVGIAIGNENWGDTISSMTSSSYVVTKNKILNVVEERTFSAVGIILANTNGVAGTGSIIANNFVAGVRANGVVGEQGVGIGIAGGGNDLVVFNSILMTGDVDPPGASLATKSNVGIRVASASSSSHFSLALKNNNIQVNLTSDTTGLLHHCIVVNSVNYDFGTGGMDNNNYYFPSGNPQMRTGGIGTGTGVLSSFQFLTDWKAAMSNPQDAASMQSNPEFVSSTDLHLSVNTMTSVENGGVPIAGVTDDIDGHIRSLTMPAIGADEKLGPTAAGVEVSGRVRTASGRGIRNARIFVEGGDLAWPIIVMTNSFGYYRVEGLAAGQSYIVTVESKRFGFASPVRVVNAGDGVAGLDFVSVP